MEQADTDTSDIDPMPRLNVITGCVLLFVGLATVFWLIPFHIASADVIHYVNSPRFFPYISASVLIFLSLVLIGSNLYKICRNTDYENEESEENEILGFGISESVNVLAFFIGSVTYIFLFQLTGFIVSSAALLAISMFFAKIRIYLIPIIAIGLPFLIKQLLWHTLQVNL